jgi:hypothetical protein
MGRSETAVISLEEAKGRFEEWRSNRKEKAGIPAEFWSCGMGRSEEARGEKGSAATERCQCNYSAADLEVYRRTPERLSS